MIVLNEMGTPQVNTIHNCDALKLLGNMPSNSVDLLITDPPYFTTVTSLSKKTPAYDKLKSDGWELTTDWIPEAIRVLKRGAAFYAFCGTDEMSYMIKEFKDAQCKITNTLVWIKTNPLPSFTKRTYRGAIEMAIYGCKEVFGYMAERKQQELMPYWFEPIVQGDERTVHPTQKPLRIIKEWIANSCPQGGVVLDPFMGSGTVAVAARDLGFQYIGSEISSEYVAVARDRLRMPFEPRHTRGITTVSDLPLFAHASA